MQSLLQSPFCLQSTPKIDPEMATLACGSILPLNCKGSFTLTCCLFPQSGNVDKKNKNPVRNQETIMCRVKRENIIGVLT